MTCRWWYRVMAGEGTPTRLLLLLSRKTWMPTSVGMTVRGIDHESEHLAVGIKPARRGTNRRLIICADGRRYAAGMSDATGRRATVCGNQTLTEVPTPSSLSIDN